MPIYLPPISRRRFLSTTATGVLAAGSGWLTFGNAAERESGDFDPHSVALLSDTHIFHQRDAVHRGTNMYDNMRAAAQQIAALSTLPSSLLINGDCAFMNGQAEDYVVFLETLAPYRQAGLPVHFTLGNHDDRANFWNADAQCKSGDAGVDNRHLSIVKTERANWFLLDSLDRTNATPGLLGDAQLAWLAKALDAHADKPAILVVHHQPLEGESVASGLKDTKALYDIIVPRTQLKAYVFGHTHHWHQREHEGIHLINLPPVAYPFNRTDPSGWVQVKLEGDGASFQLNAIDQKHTAHGDRFEVKWRT